MSRGARDGAGGVSAERIELEEPAPMKRCAKHNGGYGKWLPVSAFQRNRRNPDGLQNYCCDCQNALSRICAARTYERIKARMTEDPAFAEARRSRMREYQRARREAAVPKPHPTYRPEEGLRRCGAHDGGRGAWLPFSAFGRYRRGPGGLAPTCRECRNAESRARYAADPESAGRRQVTALVERYRADPVYRQKHLDAQKASRERRKAGG